MGEWWIRYRLIDSEDECMVVMPSIPRLLLWIVKYGSKCSEVNICLIED